MEQRSGQNLSLCLAFPNVSIIQAHMLQGQDRKIPAHTWATCKFRHVTRHRKGLLLVDADVSCGADASRGQGLEDNRRVQAGKAGSAHIGLNVDASESQLGSFTHCLHGKYFLRENAHKWALNQINECRMVLLQGTFWSHSAM